MKQYLEALKYIMEHGEECSNRTGINTKSVFGYQMRFNLSQGFPAVTTKKLAWKSVVGELLWFLEGSTDERRLAEITFEKDRKDLVEKPTIWTANADAQGKALGYVNTPHNKQLGPVYGYQWRNFGGNSWIRDGEDGFDQIEWIINELKTNPESRRIILSSWSASQVELMALPPCHTLAQFRVTNGKLSCQLYQRSADMFLGVPFNIASYSLLTHMLAKLSNLQVGDFIWTGGDCHIYENHYEQVKLQVSREERELPKLVMPEFTSLYELLKTTTSQYILENYNPMDPIKAEMAV